MQDARCFVASEVIVCGQQPSKFASNLGQHAGLVSAVLHETTWSVRSSMSGNQAHLRCENHSIMLHASHNGVFVCEQASTMRT